MKKRLLLIVGIAILLGLAGCGGYPDRAEDGTAWDQSWEMLGRVLGVEAPGNGFTLLENNVVLGADDTWYATWTAGEPEPYVNEDGKDTDLYPAQIYLLLYGCENEDRAAEASADWIAREQETYRVLETRTEAYNGQEYTVLVYEVTSETNPYARGVSAFGRYHNYVVVAELTCVDSFAGDEQKLMADFLGGCHYSADRIR